MLANRRWPPRSITEPRVASQVDGTCKARYCPGCMVFLSPRNQDSLFDLLVESIPILQRLISATSFNLARTTSCAMPLVKEMTQQFESREPSGAWASDRSRENE